LHSEIKGTCLDKAGFLVDNNWLQSMFIFNLIRVMSFTDFLNPETIIQFGGLTLLLIIVFAETGVFFGFCLPGDSLLFVAGLLCGTPYLNIPLSLLIVVLIVAAVLGSTVGYYSGRWAGNYFQTRQDNFIFKKQRLEIARDFYSRHGALAFILGRFLPIVRTFVPIVAGIVRIDPLKFLTYNISGATIWITTFVLSGYWLGNTFPFLTNSLEIVMVTVILISIIPLVIPWLKKKLAIAQNKS
jgi:membrane-associated protein